MSYISYKLYVKSVYSGNYIFVHMWNSRSSALSYIKKHPGFDYRICRVNIEWYSGCSCSEKIISVKDYAA